MEPELIGTGVFLAIGNRRFVFTAAHVFGPPGEGSQHLYIPSDRTGNLTELLGTHVRSKSNEDSSEHDTNDVGIVLLDDDLAGQINPDSFVRIDSVDVDDIGDFQRPYMAMGFPWRVSPKVCLRSRMATATHWSYATELLRNEDLLKLGLGRKSHFLLRYAKRHSRNESGRDITAPHPQGVSGGPVWRLDQINDRDQTSRLVGIVIEWREEVGGLLATRLPMTLAGIGQLCPDIAHLIPRTRTLAIEITSPPLAT